MKNNTIVFLNLIKQTLNDNQNYYDLLDKEMEQRNSWPHIREKILKDLNIQCDEANFNDGMNNALTSHIKNYIENYKANEYIDCKILREVSLQFEIDYLLGKLNKTKAEFYCHISEALQSCGIIKNQRLASFNDTIFWKNLIHLLCLLRKASHYRHSFYHERTQPLNSKFHDLNKLVKSKRIVEKYLNEKITIIDGKVIFKEKQEERFINKIERENLSNLNIISCLGYILKSYELGKKDTVKPWHPYKYIINIFIKNLSRTTNKPNNQKIIKTVDLLEAFITLYQLKPTEWETRLISTDNVLNLLKKQVLYSNFYVIPYPVKVNTLTKFIENIIAPCLNENIFKQNTGFNLIELYDFFHTLGRENKEIAYFTEHDCSKVELSILNFFSTNANTVNHNYSTIDNLPNTKNLFDMNPVIKLDNSYLVIGFKYFKMNFYNSLINKIMVKKIDTNITGKIGKQIDVFVEKIFSDIQKNTHYEIFSGEYTPSISEQPESDLLLKLDNEIILIENKNKYLTGLSFSGDKSSILKDLVLSFIHSQKQLFNHLMNLQEKKTITFNETKKQLSYNNENIIKISVSSNNWFNIMTNNTRELLPSIMNLQFDIKDSSDKHYIKDNKHYIEANKLINELNNIITDLEKKSPNMMSVYLNQTLFLPLELLVEKHNDTNFIRNLRYLVAMSVSDISNIMDIYDYINKLHAE